MLIKPNNFLNTINPLLLQQLEQEHSIKIEDILNHQKIEPYHLILYKTQLLEKIHTDAAKASILLAQRKARIGQDQYKLYKELISSSETIDVHNILTKYAYLYMLYIDRSCHSQFLKQEIKKLNLNNLVTDLLLLSKMSYEVEDTFQKSQKLKLLLSVIRKLDKDILKYSPNWMYLFLYRLLTVERESQKYLKDWKNISTTIYQSHYTDSVSMLLLQRSIKSDKILKKEQIRQYNLYVKKIIECETSHYIHIINFIKIIDYIKNDIPSWGIVYDLISVIEHIQELQILQKNEIISRLKSKLIYLQKTKKKNKGKLINRLLLKNKNFSSYKLLQLNNDELEILTCFFQDNKNLELDQIKRFLKLSVKFNIDTLIKYYFQYYLQKYNHFIQSSYEDAVIFLSELPNLAFLFTSLFNAPNNMILGFNKNTFNLINQLILQTKQSSRIIEKFILFCINNSLLQNIEDDILIKLIVNIEDKKNIIYSLIKSDNKELLVKFITNHQFLSEVYKTNAELIINNIFNINQKVAYNLLISFTKEEFAHFIKQLFQSLEDINKPLLYLNKFIFYLLENSYSQKDKVYETIRNLKEILISISQNNTTNYYALYLKYLIQDFTKEIKAKNFDQKRKSYQNIVDDLLIDCLINFSKLNILQYQNHIDEIEEEYILNYYLKKFLQIKNNETNSKKDIKNYSEKIIILSVLQSVTEANVNNKLISFKEELLTEKNCELYPYFLIPYNSSDIDYYKFHMINAMEDLELKLFNANNEEFLENSLKYIFQFFDNNLSILRRLVSQYDHEKEIMVDESFLDNLLFIKFISLVEHFVVRVVANEDLISTSTKKDLYKFNYLFRKNYFMTFKPRDHINFIKYLMGYYAFASFKFVIKPQDEDHLPIVLPMLNIVKYLSLFNVKENEEDFFKELQKIAISHGHVIDIKQAFYFLITMYFNNALSNQMPPNHIDFLINADNRYIIENLFKRIGQHENITYRNEAIFNLTYTITACTHLYGGEECVLLLESIYNKYHLAIDSENPRWGLVKKTINKVKIDLLINPRTMKRVRKKDLQKFTSLYGQEIQNSLKDSNKSFENNQTAIAKYNAVVDKLSTSNDVSNWQRNRSLVRRVIDLKKYVRSGRKF